MTGHYRGAHAAAVARSGFSCYRAIGGMFGGCASTGDARLSSPASGRGAARMKLPPPPDRWTIDIANAERLNAIASFGFTERQARFLLNVLLHSGVFVERQYLLVRRHRPRPEEHRLHQDARRAKIRDADCTGKLHRGRMFHVHYKPLWAAVGEPDNRWKARRSGPDDRARDAPRCGARRADLHLAWSARDKRRYFIRHLESRLDAREYPHLTFGDGPEKTVQFPDKLPIGVLPGLDHHAFIYLQRAGHRWTSGCSFCGMCRSSVCSSDGRFGALPRPLEGAPGLPARRARAPGRAPGACERSGSRMAVPRAERLAEPGAAPADERYLKTSKNFGAPRFRALYRQWLEDRPTRCGWLARPRLPTRSIAIMAASSASSSRVSTSSLSG